MIRFYIRRGILRRLNKWGWTQGSIRLNYVGILYGRALK